MSTQRGRKRGPYKPRVPKTAQDAARSAEITTVNEAIIKAIETGEPQMADPPVYQGEVKIEYKTSVEPQPVFRFVRFHYGWGEDDTAPAILYDSSTLAVLLPPTAVPAAACKFRFRAPAGGWSFVHAQEGADPGQYQEV